MKTPPEGSELPRASQRRVVEPGAHSGRLDPRAYLPPVPAALRQ